MITEAFLRTHDKWVKYLTGLTAPQFWSMFSRIEADFEEYERQRHERPGRKRAVGAGRPFAVPLLIRVVAVITYLRLHLAQEFIGMGFGIDQVQISRDLRWLLPLIRRHVPAPQVLELLPEEERPVDPLEALRAAFGEEGIALLDATEQPLNRPKDAERQREFYSGKKKRHTVKTQIGTNRAGDIAAITPPVPGKTADIKLAEQSRVAERLPEGIDAYADKGYQGLDKRVPSRGGTVDGDAEATETVPRLRVHTPTKKPKGGALTPEQQERNRALGRVRIRVEHAIGRAKNWHILADRFRCHLDIYEEAFRLWIRKPAGPRPSPSGNGSSVTAYEDDGPGRETSSSYCEWALLYRAERETELRTRWHALWLLRKGSSLQETAQVVGVHLRTLFKGLSWYRQGGIEAIRQHRQGNRKGRPPFLTPEQCAQLRERAADGGFTSLEEARQWVEQTFCVRYTLWGIRSLFQRLKITRKMPRPRAAQASPEVQQAWKKGAWKPL